MDASLVELSKVEEAVAVLKQFVEKTQGPKSKQLFPSESAKLSLQLGFHKIPRVRQAIIKIGLPHSLLGPSNSLCLFVKDIDPKDADVTIEFYKDLFRSKGITAVPEVIPLRALKTEYKPYEAKRNLSNAYDGFFVDARIYRLLPALLGKHFYGRKKFPVKVDLLTPDLKKAWNSSLSTVQCVVTGSGSSSCVEIGSTHQPSNDVVANVMAACDTLSKKVPGGMPNFKSLYLKASTSPALPIYISKASGNDVVVPQKKRKAVIECDDVTTVMGGKVLVTPWGSVNIIPEGSEPVLPQKKPKFAKKPRKETNKKQKKSVKKVK